MLHSVRGGLALSIAIVSSQAALAAAQQAETPEKPREEPVLLEPTVVTATRVEAQPFETPYAVEAIPEETIRERSYRTVPQILRDVPGVMVQETSVGQGSPYIRGFTGFRNLFLIDGIRLNNSVFREGPNQYWNTVDPLSVERLELVKGPTSVLYGSDAIGGTVNAITRMPYAYRGAGRHFDGSLFYRISSAEQSHVTRAEASAAQGNDWGVLVGGGVKVFGDVRGGEDIGTQENTGYDEWDGDLKVERLLGDTRLVAAYQLVGQNDVPRTHSTIFAESFEGTSVGSDLKRDLDQDRRLAYVQVENEELEGALDRASFGLSWHVQEETEDRIRSTGSRTEQGFDVGTFGFFTTFGAPSSAGRFTFGLDYYRDNVDSFSSASTIQGPVADDAIYDLAGVFVQDELSLSERTDLVLGLRGNYAAVDAESVLDPVTSGQTTLDEEWGAVVGSARVLHRWTEALNLFGGISQGFRAPNLSDLTRLDSARSNEFEIPAPGLDPEHTLNYEVGVKTKSERWETQSAVFYTDIDDQVVKVPTGNVLPTGELEITKRNAGDGWVFGVETGAAYEFQPGWTLFGNATYLEGKIENFPTSSGTSQEEYLDRLMPLSAALGLAWREEEDRRWAETELVWADDADKLSPGDKLDTQRIPPGGTPGYVVLHVRGGLQLGRHTTLDVGLENVANEDHRVHGSGSNAPGRNLIVGLTFAP